ncbi:tRNA threonylcarbamoyladenosine dehydratase [Pelomyxa schiedti]|nr:tRNA threonylcarbamoyladenosine dehydratase [Pelomyxa schiedti]
MMDSLFDEAESTTAECVHKPHDQDPQAPAPTPAPTAASPSSSPASSATGTAQQQQGSRGPGADDWQQRTKLLLGEDAVGRLAASLVVVVGIGGVGGYCVEGLVRAGVGRLLLYDADVVALSNLNRQIIATRDTVGRHKVDVACERARSINPGVHVEGMFKWFSETDDLSVFGPHKPDFIVDATDCVPVKLRLISLCTEAGIPVLSSMGMARRRDPTKVRIKPLKDTTDDPLATSVRRILRKRGNPAALDTPVLISKEKPDVVPPRPEDDVPWVPQPDQSTVKFSYNTRQPLGSLSTVPAAAGLAAAYYIVNLLTSTPSTSNTDS